MPWNTVGGLCSLDRDRICGENCIALSTTVPVATKPSIRHRVYRNGTPKTYDEPLTAALIIGGNHELRI